MIAALFCTYLYFHEVLKNANQHRADSETTVATKPTPFYGALTPFLTASKGGSSAGGGKRGRREPPGLRFHLDGAIWTRSNSKVV